jgi:hypothetical protein
MAGAVPISDLAEGSDTERIHLGIDLLDKVRFRCDIEVDRDR